jgi:hypothetical protein
MSEPAIIRRASARYSQITLSAGHCRYKVIGSGAGFVRDRQRMQRPIHTIQCGEVDELPRLVCVDVWLTELDSAENAQLRELSSAPLNSVEVASHVERFWNQQAVIAHQRTKMIE